MSLPNVIIIGRPNVGKSRLFNRLVGNRIAIVHDEAGITRDCIFATVDNRFSLVDTGGIFGHLQNTPTVIAEAVQEQVRSVINLADVVLFVIDGREGCTFIDLEIADFLRKSNKKILLVANKMDLNFDGTIEDWPKLGFAAPIRVSAEHGTGINNLMDHVNTLLKEVAVAAQQPVDKGIKICFIGRPNVGKSSITNALLEQKRCIVTEVPGTTRDAIDVPFIYKGSDGESHPFTLIDTAGLRSRSKQDTSAEFFSSVRTQDAIQRADIVFLIINTGEGITKFDRAIAGQIVAEKKPLGIILNKWDLMPSIQEESVELAKMSPSTLRMKIRELLQESLYELPPFPVIFVSALTRSNIPSIPETALKIHQRLQKAISTGQLNRAVSKLLEDRPSLTVNGRKFKCFYAVQISKSPIVIRLFCNRRELLSEQYQHYLTEKLSETFELSGCPIQFECIEKEARWA